MGAMESSACARYEKWLKTESDVSFLYNEPGGFGAISQIFFALPIPIFWKYEPHLCEF